VTAFAWLAVAGAILVGVTPATAPARMAALAAGGRLTGVRSGRSSAPSRPANLRWLATVAVTGLVVGVVAFGGVLLGVAAGAAGGAGSIVGRDVAAGRAASVRRRQLLGALRVLIGELEAGGRAAAALSAAAEFGPAYATVFGSAAAAAAGAHDAGAVLAANPDTRVIGLAWQLGEETGTALAGVLSRVTADLAEADGQRRTVAVALAGPRASAALLTGLPLLGIAMGAAMGARPWAFLAGSAVGRAVCCAGVVLDVAGVLWMRTILRRAERP
jgi:tight adherence protein B